LSSPRCPSLFFLLFVSFPILMLQIGSFLQIRASSTRLVQIKIEETRCYSQNNGYPLHLILALFFHFYSFPF
jgi:hypothetical protein